MSGWQTVRVFISSTFSDMHAERDYLVCEVFPLLREWCAARRIHLIDVDLRWGVTEDEAQSNSKLIETCLSNIDRCHPFFLCLLGQRRGFIPMIQRESEGLFTQFPSLKVHAGESSITELEILHAIERTTNPNFLLFFQREPDYLKDIGNLALLRKIYTGNAQAIPEQMVVSLPWQAVRYSTVWDRAQRTPEIAIPTYCNSQYPEIVAGWRKKWIDAGIPVPEGCTRLDSGLLENAEALNAELTQGRLTNFEADGKALGTVIREALCKAILEEYPDHAEPLDFDSQDAFIEQEHAYYIMPKDVQHVLDDYARSAERVPLLIVSPPGYGKTALLANWSLDLPSVQVIKGFAEASGFDDLPAFAKRIAERINIGSSEGNIFQTPMDTLLTRAPTGGILVLDGWDLLDPALESGWLQKKLAEGVKLIISLNSDSPRATQLITFLEKESLAHIYELPCLSLSDKQKLIDAYLDQFLKKLDLEFVKTLVSQPAADTPLYLRVALSLLRIHNSYERLGDLISAGIGPTVNSAIHGTLARLFELPKIVDTPARVIVACLFPLMCTARHNLSVPELAEAMASMPDLNNSRLAGNLDMLQQEINRLLYLSESFVRRIGNCYRPASAELAAVCTDMFPVQTVQAHAALVHLYQRQMNYSDVSRRTEANNALLDIVHHTLKFDSAGAVELLSNPSFLQRRISLGFISALRNDLDAAAAAAPILGELSKLLDICAYILLEHPTSFANLFFFYGSPRIRSMVEQWLQKGLLPDGLLELEPIELPQPTGDASSALSVEILYSAAGWSPVAYACAPGRDSFMACMYMGELTVLDNADSEAFSTFPHSLKFPIDPKPVRRMVASRDGERLAAQASDGTFACYRIGYDFQNVPVGVAKIFSGEYQKSGGNLTAMGWVSHTLVWQQAGALHTFDTESGQPGPAVPLEGELVWIGEVDGKIFLVINGRTPRYLTMDNRLSLVEIGNLPCPALAADCRGDAYAVAAWNGEVRISKNGREFSLQMRQPVRSCVITQDGVVCIDMQKGLSHIAWDGTLSMLGLAPEEAVGNGSQLFVNGKVVMAISAAGRCRFAVGTEMKSHASIHLLPGCYKRVLYVESGREGEKTWLVDQQTRASAYFFAQKGGEYVSNDLGEMCSDASYGFHEWLPNTVDIPGHSLPVIRMDEHIRFSIKRQAGGFYLFSENAIYHLNIRNRSAGFSLPSDDETTCTRVTVLEPGMTAVRATSAGRNILLLCSQAIPMQSNLDVLLLLHESEQGELLRLPINVDDPFGELDLSGCSACDDKAEGFYIGSRSGLFHLSRDGTIQRLDVRMYYPITNMCFIPMDGIFYTKEDELCSFNVETRRKACFIPLEKVTGLAEWGSEAVTVVGNLRAYQIHWRL